MSLSAIRKYNRTCYRHRVTAQPVLTRVPQGELIGADRLSPRWPQASVLFTESLASCDDRGVVPVPEGLGRAAALAGRARGLAPP
jgi:hypothetical protein